MIGQYVSFDNVVLEFAFEMDRLFDYSLQCSIVLYANRTDLVHKRIERPYGHMFPPGRHRVGEIGIHYRDSEYVGRRVRLVQGLEGEYEHLSSIGIRDCPDGLISP